MTDQAIAEQSPQQRGAIGKSKPLRVTGRLKTACDAIALEGLGMYEAGQRAGISTHSVRQALARPHVIAYLKAQREVLRASMCGANILALADVRDQRENHNARVAAVKALEQLGDEDPARRAQLAAPGFVILIAQPNALMMPHHQPDDGKPLIEHDKPDGVR